jgi:putative endonuclease
VSNDNLDFGRSAEEAAARFLKGKGYKILFRNYKTRLGEIDIIAKDKDVFCFIEVKARRSEKFGLPQEAVSGFKIRQISKSALVFLKDKDLLNKAARFDVVAIGYCDEQPSIELFKNAFELSVGYIP